MNSEKQLEAQGYTDDFFEMKPEVDEKIKNDLLLHKKEKTKIKFFKKVAVFAVSILTALTFTQVNVQAYIEYFQDIVVEVFEDYSNLFFGSDEENQSGIKYVTDAELYAPTYIPPQYEKATMEINSNHNIITYSGDLLEDIVYQQNIISDGGATVSYDEGTTVENITTIFGETVYFFEESTGQRVIFFSFGGYVHYVTGFVELDVLIEIAESIALVEINTYDALN